MEKLTIEKIPKTGHIEKFSVKDGKSMIFGFSDTLLSIWGRPTEEELKRVIQAFVDKFGILEEEKILTSYDVSGSLNNYLESLK